MTTVLFIILVLIYITACYFIVFHLLRFGVGSETKLMAIIFSVGVIVLLISLIVSYSMVM